MHKSKTFGSRMGAPGWLAGAALCVSLILTACSGKVSDDSIRYLRAGDLARWVAKTPDKYLIIDSRGPEAYDQGHIPGARRMTLPELDPENLDPDWSRYSAIIVYGADPGSEVARAMTKRLIKAKLTEVYQLEGGMLAWKSSGGQVVSFGANP